ncbi:Bug family tripartite tricarboxylate transporter substrate binding protein [Caldinitratiruptor microaerophilus]|uniref:Tricarboxylic transport membrane protein n=1 Tax=Caldinitratiruptor microaerophilus TaxID=671077 RepID=A0AA35CKK0_9FIRM|nr:tripartite tricarboxylate transporter substrate binding protein [Caldinitratiruptor microaerophilus]BDG61004.1 hypothetical protein caldi_20940 [Caldinitratiruptor microaerophilus]
MRGKRFVALLAAGVVAMVLAGCGGGGGTKPQAGGSQAQTQPSGQTQPQAQAKASYPDKPIEFVVPYAAGGGSDVLARNIVQSLQDTKALSQPVVVVNKPGSSGQVGGAYVAQKKGDAYTIMTFISGQVSAPLTVQGGIKASTFTPLANLAMDEFLLVVTKDSPFKTVQDFINKARSGEKAVSIGGTATGAEDHMLTGIVEKAAGVKLNYIPFESGGEVMTNLLGKQVDVAWANPNEAMSQIEAGLVRPIAVAAPERMPMFPDVPTFKESGLDVVFRQFRGVVGPPDMPADAVKFWADTLKKVTEDPGWQERYAKKNGLTIRYLGPEDFKKLIAEEEPRYAQILKDIGVIK